MDLNRVKRACLRVCMRICVFVYDNEVTVFNYSSCHRFNSGLHTKVVIIK